MTEHNDLLKKDKELIWHPFTPLVGATDPLLITKGEGVYLHTHDGRKILDAVSSWWVNLHGHSNPHIAKAIADQAVQLEHVIFAGFTHPPAIKLATNLLSILPGNQSRIFYSDNGSTAVEVGLKMAMQYWHNKGIDKPKIVAIQGAYHGDTFGAMAVGDRGLFTRPFFPYLFEVDFIDLPEADKEELVFNQFKALVDTGKVGAFVFEPLVQASAGMRMYSAFILDRLIHYAQQHDVICIADEVFTGFGRTGKMFACNYLQHLPDILALSKGLTGGTLPMGITSCTDEIVAAYQTDEFAKTFFHGHSYTANPLACAAANASFELLMQPSCTKNIQRINARHETFKETLPKDNIKEVRITGTILAIELNSGETHYTNDIRKSIYRYFMERDLLLRPLGNVIYVLPPYIITDQELDHIYNNIRGFLTLL